MKLTDKLLTLINVLTYGNEQKNSQADLDLIMQRLSLLDDKDMTYLKHQLIDCQGEDYSGDDMELPFYTAISLNDINYAIVETLIDKFNRTHDFKAMISYKYLTADTKQITLNNQYFNKKQIKEITDFFKDYQVKVVAKKFTSVNLSA